VIGGALKLCDASLIFSHNGTNVKFFNNSARKGGAIYIQQACMDTSPLCFFQPSFPKDTPIREFEKHMKLTFVNNSADIAGDAIYGGEFDRCSTIVPFIRAKSPENQDYLLFPHILDKVFDMQEQQGPSWISSNPQQVCFCHGSQKNNNRSCETNMESIEVYPGEEFVISVITVGQMYGSTAGMINASLEDEQEKSHTLVKPKLPEMSSECTNMTFALHSNRGSAIINLRPLTSELITRYNVTPVELNVKILQCPLGFDLTKSPPYTCVCSLVLSKYLRDYSKLGYSPVTCNVTSREISIPARRLWFGCYDQQYQNNTANCSNLVVTPNCNYYCNQENDIINVSISHLDSQCSPNHTGVMCGACKPGYSRILGSILECRKDCTNTNLIILIPFFLVSGVILIIIIMALNLTVTEGTLNGLLMYSMIIQTHHSYFGENNLSLFGKICWVFISWINLTFGIRACFYKGMDAYQYTWVLFILAFYLVSLLAVIVYLTKRFIFFTRLFGRNIVKVLATIIFLLYSNIVFATFIAFQYATLHYSTPNSTLHSKMVWYIDGNVPYLGREHAPLYIVALLWSMAMCFYMFSLMLIQCLQRQPNVWCLRWIIKLKPFYDAYTGPCRDSYRFWPGFLLFMRTGIYIMNSTVPAYSVVFFQLKMLITAAICVIIMSLACIFPHGVYKRWPLNILEFSFLLNLCITSGILGLSSHSRQRFYAVNTSVSISAFTFLGILVYHCHRRIKDVKLWRKFTTWLSVRSRVSHIVRAKQPNESDETLNSNSDTERAFLLPQSLPSVVRFDECREPLVEP
jgi:predicted outer membrane repeat protein